MRDASLLRLGGDFAPEGRVVNRAYQCAIAILDGAFFCGVFGNISEVNISRRNNKIMYHPYDTSKVN